MKIITTIKEMKLISAEARGEGLTVVLVPTMGFLHDGHIELLNRGREEGHFLVMSLFVNPTQFNDANDLENYPADIDGDLEKAKSAGVDVVFMPTTDEMYPEDFKTTVEVKKLSEYLCGASREGHFTGVATIVTKLFGIIEPHKAVFGEKDYQQLLIIKTLVEDLSFDIEIIAEPTVREEDGLAMSSRNSRLTESQRETAKVIPLILSEINDLVVSGQTKSKSLLKHIDKIIKKEPTIEVEYISICDKDTLKEIKQIKDSALIALAIKIGNTRLIDNCLITI